MSKGQMKSTVTLEQAEKLLNIAQNGYVGVYVWGGIIHHVEFYHDLEDGINRMKHKCEENRFDRSEDDARIFPLVFPLSESPVYSYDPDRYEDHD